MQAKGTWGLGIVNTQIFNECLMVKWIWKLYNQKDSLWARQQQNILRRVIFSGQRTRGME
jgi:hypothetical protein